MKTTNRIYLVILAALLAISCNCQRKKDKPTANQTKKSEINTKKLQPVRCKKWKSGKPFESLSELFKVIENITFQLKRKEAVKGKTTLMYYEGKTKAGNLLSMILFDSRINKIMYPIRVSEAKGGPIWIAHIRHFCSDKADLSSMSQFLEFWFLRNSVESYERISRAEKPFNKKEISFFDTRMIPAIIAAREAKEPPKTITFK